MIFLEENILLRPSKWWRVLPVSAEVWAFVVKFVKFAVVGFTCMLIDFGITWLVKEKLRLGKYVANAGGFITSATVNFFLNRMWTFQDSSPDMVFQYTKFISVAGIGLLINTGVLYYFHHNRGMKFYFSKLIATGVTVFWNFGANQLFVFHG